MTRSVLGNLCLSYQPLWNRQRDISGVLLGVASNPAQPVDAPHLLRTLDELWTPHSPPLLLAVQTPALLSELLAQARVESPSIVVPHLWLDDVSLVQAAFAAHDRGVHLVWRGSSALLPEPELAACFDNCLLTLSPEDALVASVVAKQWQAAQLPLQTLLAKRSPAPPKQLYENVTSRTLVHHCLDQRHAKALIGWPTDDVLHARQGHAMQPARAVITTLIRVLDADESMEVVEQVLSKDPVLVYRFLCHANSPTLGLQSGIDSLRRAIMMMGYANLRAWLLHQLPLSLDDNDLKPIKTAMVLRAKLMEGLLEAGEEDELRREVYLCGLFSQIDQLLGVRLGTSVRSLPLSERIFEATLSHTGPYAPSLQLACALEHDEGARLRQLCDDTDTDIEQVNRVLLRTLSAIYVRPTHGHPGERRRRSRGRRFGK